MPRSLVLALVFLLLGAGAASARGDAPVCAASCKAAPAGSGALLVLSGHGWGHGVGMSQYGAYGYAQHGWTYQQIVTHYFAGTTLGPAPVSRVRVLLADRKKSLTVASDADFTVKDGAGTVHPVSAGSYPFGPGLRIPTADAATPAPLPGPLTFTASPAAPLQLGGKPYRGSFQVDVVNRKLRAIDIVGLEQYLYGVVPSEMPYTWAAEALEAQAVAARSYALSNRAVAAPFDLYSDTRSQVYLGIAHERPSTNAAVDATAGQVLLYGGQVAHTYFFSTSGGRTANAADIWTSGTSLPYLVAVPDPYDSISPYHDWGPVPFTGAALAKAFRVPGGVTDAQTTLNASGRVSTLSLLGPQGQVDVPAGTVRTKLKLRSTWFDVGVLSLSRPLPAAPVEFGGAVQLSGVARGIAGVALEQRSAGSTWQAVGPVAPAADGTVAIPAKPTVTTDYRLATTTAAAAPVRIAVAPRIRFYADKTPDHLRGLVRPVLTGAPVAVQSQDAAGAWTTVATTTVDANGDFDATLQLATGTYRARIAATKGFVAGTTPPLSVVTARR
ncbi:MAG: SpoIID/LytB domain-containing protein [Actinobacteria bacterium]|nr:MAG: SpoIID/LytB domain-containing protein [Actinomycetota bacterium]